MEVFIQSWISYHDHITEKYLHNYPEIAIISGVSREGAQGARAPPLALAKHNILYS